MRNKMVACLVAVMAIAPAVTPVAAVAQRYDDRGPGGRGPGDRGPGDRHRGDRGPNGPRDYRWNGDRNGGWDPSQHYYNGRGYDERRMGRNDRIYRGGDGRYYCRRNDGTTGLVIGALGGGLLGGAIGGNTLGALLGAGGGALLGRSVDRGQVRCR